MRYGLQVLLIFTGMIFIVMTGISCNTASTSQPGSPLEFVIRDIRNDVLDLSQYKGNVVLMVNTATGCGFSPQFFELQKLYETYRDRDFIVLGFPSNSFKQENRSEEEIIQFCNDTFLVDFPLTRKIGVTGPDRHPLYKYLTEPSTNPGFAGDITWNFEKFLIGRDEKIIARFSPDTAPDDPQVVNAIERALEEHPLRNVLLMRKSD